MRVLRQNQRCMERPKTHIINTCRHIVSRISHFWPFWLSAQHSAELLSLSPVYLHIYMCYQTHTHKTQRIHGLVPLVNQSIWCSLYDMQTHMQEELTANGLFVLLDEKEGWESVSDVYLRKERWREILKNRSLITLQLLTQHSHSDLTLHPSLDPFMSLHPSLTLFLPNPPIVLSIWLFLCLPLSQHVSSLFRISLLYV